MGRSPTTVGRLRRARLRLRPPFLVIFTLSGLAAVVALTFVVDWVVTKDVSSEHLHEPIATAITSQSLRLQLILAGAALLFYAAMLPRLIAVSKAARENFDPAGEILMLELGMALDAEALELHYQPIVELASGRVCAMESFLRWNHPRRGPLAPSEYLTAAAQTDLIGPLTLYILNRALRDCRAWREDGIDAGVHVNLSEANVLDERLPDELGKLLVRWRIPSNLLCLEVTEQAIAANPEHAADILAGLDEMGVLISIDDFGTGYSSLAGLRDLPVSELKIDRTFISGLTRVDRDAAIARSIVALAQDLGVRVIAEGVEDAATLQRLQGLGCDGAQGHYFAPALALPELHAWLSAPTAGAAKGEVAPVFFTLGGRARPGARRSNTRRSTALSSR